jgi:hypothetical protein
MVLGLCHHLAAVRPIMPSDPLPAVENLYAARRARTSREDVAALFNVNRSTLYRALAG